VKRVRVRKARRSGACPRCRRLVLVGELIASVRGGPFMCISHVTREDTDGRTSAAENSATVSADVSTGSAAESAVTKKQE
jgi:hypothetical protein